MWIVTILYAIRWLHYQKVFASLEKDKKKVQNKTRKRKYPKQKCEHIDVLEACDWRVW